jgi:CheY-like chemotaxis protein
VPVAVTAAERMPPSVAAAGVAAHLEPGLRVLVADDNPVNALLLRHLLERMGCEVQVVTDGMQAVAAWRRGQFDAILLDRYMPGMDGLEATVVIRAAGELGRQATIIGLSAGLPDVEQRACLAAGMDDYLEKPIGPAALAEALSKLRRPQAPLEIRIEP